METNQYMGIFLEEAREHLLALNRCLLDLENDPGNTGILDEVFRSAHTIKGMSATMGFTDIAELTHNMENTLDLLRKGELSAGEEILDILFQCVDTLEQQIENVAVGSEDKPVINGLIDKLTALNSKSSMPKQAANIEADDQKVSAINLNDVENDIVEAARCEGMNIYEIQVLLREGCVLKAARAYMVLTSLEDLGDIIKSVPSTEELEKENFDNSFQLVMVTDAEQEKVQQVIESIAEIEKAVVAPIDHAADTAAAAYEKMTTSAVGGEKQTQSAHPNEGAGTSIHNQHEKKSRANQSVRVDIDKLDCS